MQRIHTRTQSTRCPAPIRVPRVSRPRTRNPPADPQLRVERRGLGLVVGISISNQSETTMVYSCREIKTSRKASEALQVRRLHIQRRLHRDLPGRQGAHRQRPHSAASAGTRGSCTVSVHTIEKLPTNSDERAGVAATPTTMPPCARVDGPRSPESNPD